MAIAIQGVSQTAPVQKVKTNEQMLCATNSATGDLMMSEQQLQTTPSEAAIVEAGFFFRKLGLDDVWEKEKAFAVQVIRESRTLQNCTPDSIRKAVANVALTGLTLDPTRKLAFLIPRKGICILQPSYRGLIKSVTQTGAVIAFEAKVVYFGDEFEYEEGLSPILRHKSLDLKEELADEDKKHLTARKRDPYSQIRCAYSIAILPGGVRTSILHPKWKIDKAKACAQGTDKPTSPWKVYPEEQVRKTVLAYHTKTLDVGEQAATAVQLFHDNDGMSRIAEEVTSSVLLAMKQDSPVDYITESQAADIRGLIAEVGRTEQQLCVAMKLESVDLIPSTRHKEVVKKLEAMR